MIVLQLALFCAFFTGMVKLSTLGGAVNALYFYPKPFQERAFALGLADREAVRKKGMRFMAPFLLLLLAALLLIIGVWNRVSDFKTAYLQSLLFLEVMNWYDGIVIDRLWVGHSSLWIIPGMEGVPYVKPWSEVLKRRGAATVLYFVVAAVVAGLVMLMAWVCTLF